MALVIALVPLIDPQSLKRHEKDERFESEAADVLVENGLARSPDASDEVNKEEAKSSESGEAPAWTKKIPPKEYLEKYPEGPAAELARKILAVEAEKAGASTSEES